MYILIEVVLALWEILLTVNPTVIGSITTRGNKLFNIFTSSLMYQGKAKSSSATQHAMHPGN